MVGSVGGGEAELPGAGALGMAAEGEVGDLEAEGEGIPDGAGGAGEGEMITGGADAE